MPYDIIQLKNGLEISSEEFLQQYTFTLMGKNGLPAIILKMKDNDEKSCPFVTSQGCRVYDSRPWACRIYPLQPETTKIIEKRIPNNDIFLYIISPKYNLINHIFFRINKNFTYISYAVKLSLGLPIK